MQTSAEMPMKVIAHIETDFKEKFGIPRQSGLAGETKGRIVFEKEYRVNEALRGLEGFSHIWILWQFSKAVREDWSPTVRPPVLGGNKRVGVFATRSPYRPNPIGLSRVRLEKIEYTKEEGPVIYVRGADILDNTPIFDIKPYLPYSDCYPDACGGFAASPDKRRVEVRISDKKFYELSEEKQREITEILSHDPRPSYIEEERIYGMKYGGYEIKFSASGDELTVISIEEV